MAIDQCLVELHPPCRSPRLAEHEVEEGERNLLRVGAGIAAQVDPPGEQVDEIVDRLPGAAPITTLTGFTG